jgi:hypothetical protein
MRIEIKKFGDVLVSRQAGREAFAAFLPTLKNIKEGEVVLVDFSNVNVLSPSWADEFLTPLLDRFGNNLKLIPSQNSSVKLTVQTVEEILKKDFQIWDQGENPKKF